MVFWGRSRARGTGGFTLTELMIAVCIIGVLASIALPGYSKFIMMSRSAEAPANLSLLYRGAAAYWENPSHTLKGLAATGGGGRCVAVGAAWQLTPPFPPTSEKRTGDFAADDTFRALGFAPAGPVYFTYFRASNVFQGLNCDWPAYPIDPGAPWPYMFWAISDLDGDSILGGFSLETGVRDGHLVREAGLGDLPDGRGVFSCIPWCVHGVD